MICGRTKVANRGGRKRRGDGLGHRPRPPGQDPGDDRGEQPGGHEHPQPGHARIEPWQGATESRPSARSQVWHGCAWHAGTSCRPVWAARPLICGLLGQDEGLLAVGAVLGLRRMLGHVGLRTDDVGSAERRRRPGRGRRRSQAGGRGNRIEWTQQRAQAGLADDATRGPRRLLASHAMDGRDSPRPRSSPNVVLWITCEPPVARQAHRPTAQRGQRHTAGRGAAQAWRRGGVGTRASGVGQRTTAEMRRLHVPNSTRAQHRAAQHVAGYGRSRSTAARRGLGGAHGQVGWGSARLRSCGTCTARHSIVAQRDSARSAARRARRARRDTARLSMGHDPARHGSAQHGTAQRDPARPRRGSA